MEGNGYKYRSKYSGLSAEEILEEKRKRYAEWMEGLSKEEREKLNARKREITKNQDKSGECKICGKEYKDIYQHRRTKRHIAKEKGGK